MRCVLVGDSRAVHPPVTAGSLGVQAKGRGLRTNGAFWKGLEGPALRSRGILGAVRERLGWKEGELE